MRIVSVALILLFSAVLSVYLDENQASIDLWTLAWAGALALAVNLAISAIRERSHWREMVTDRLARRRALICVALSLVVTPLHLFAVKTALDAGHASAVDNASMALFGVLFAGGLEAVRQGAAGLVLCGIGVGVLVSQRSVLDTCSDGACFPGGVAPWLSAAFGYAFAAGSAYFGARSLSVMKSLRDRFGPSVVAGLRLSGMTVGIALFASVLFILEGRGGPTAPAPVHVLVVAALLAIILWLWAVVLAHLGLAAATVPAFLIPVVTALLQYAWRALSGGPVELADAARALGAIAISAVGVAMLERRPSPALRARPGWRELPKPSFIRLAAGDSRRSTRR